MSQKQNLTAQTQMAFIAKNYFHQYLYLSLPCLVLALARRCFPIIEKRE
jgi:hypothetical protein